MVFLSLTEDIVPSFSAFTSCVAGFPVAWFQPYLWSCTARGQWWCTAVKTSTISPYKGSKGIDTAWTHYLLVRLDWRYKLLFLVN